MEYNNLINELLDLLDENKNIKEIRKLKKDILDDISLKKDIENYHLVNTIENKKKLYKNLNYVKYLEYENQINFLIYEIKSQFNQLKTSRCYHENN